MGNNFMFNSILSLSNNNTTSEFDYLLYENVIFKISDMQTNFSKIQHFHTTNSSTTSYILAIVFALDMLNWFEKMGVKYPKYPDILKRISWVHSIFLKWD